MAKYGRDVGEEIDFSPTIPHFNERGILGADTEHRWLRMQHLEIAADRNRFRDYRAVVEHQGWHALQWIDRRIFGRLVLVGSNVNLLCRHRDAFFGEKNARAAGIWRQLAVIELH